MSGWAIVLDAFGILLGGGALWVAIVSLRRSGERPQIERKRAPDRVASLKKARLSVSVDKEIHPWHKSSTYFFVITNSGVGEARELRIELDGIALSDHPASQQAPREITVLGPGSSTRFPLATHAECPIPSNVKIEWMDDSAEPGVYELTLSY